MEEMECLGFGCSVCAIAPRAEHGSSAGCSGQPRRTRESAVAGGELRGRRRDLSLGGVLSRMARVFLLLIAALAAERLPSMAQMVQAPGGQPGNISGTVTDAGGDIIPGATVTLEEPNGAPPVSTKANEYGGFAFNNVPPGGPYRIRITAPDCVPWTSPAIELQPGQFLTVQKIAVQISGGTTS